MQTKPKANSVITHSIAGKVITFHVAGAGELKLDMDKLSTENTARAMVHGLIQRVSDGAAKSRDQKTGRPASPEEKLSAMREIVAHLESGSTEWRMAGGGGGKMSNAALLREALALAYPTMTAERIAEKVESYSDSQIKAMLASEKLEPIVRKLRPAPVGGDEILAADFAE